ncbi:MAG: leucine-rich repeat protein [Aristaeellaceae bacterium]
MPIPTVLANCTLCSRQLIFTPQTPYLKCAACSTTNYHPSPDQLSGEVAPAGKPANAQLQKAHAYRAKRLYDKAEQLYTLFIADNPDSDVLHEAHWGLAMCRFGVEYVEDSLTKKILPTVNFTSPDALQDDFDYEQACSLAPEEIRSTYMENARYIDQVQDRIRHLSHNMKPFDIFLCYKHSDPDLPGHNTVDYNHAQDWYAELKSLGYNVFFADKTLREYTGADYEAKIYYALSTSRVMLLFCSQTAYLSTPWVRSEWSRFILMSKRDPQKLLMPLLYGVAPSDLPSVISANNRNQVLDMRDSFASKNLISSIANHLGTALPDVAPELDKALSALRRRDWDTAGEALNSAGQIIKADEQRSEYSDLCLYRLLLKLHLHSPEALIHCQEPFTDTQEWDQARRYATEARRASLDKLVPDRSVFANRALQNVQEALVDKRWEDASRALDTAIRYIDSKARPDDFAMTSIYRLLIRYELSNAAELARCGKPVEGTEEWQTALAGASPTFQAKMQSWAFDLHATLQRMGIKARYNADKTQAILGANCVKNQAVTALSLPEGVVAIEQDAFKNCQELRSLHLPRSLRSIAHGAIDCSRPDFRVKLYDNTPLTSNPFVRPGVSSITLIATEAPTLMIADDMLLQIADNGSRALIVPLSGKPKVTVSGNVSIIRPYAFSDSSPKAPANVVLSPSVRFIETAAFANASCLKSITLPKKLQSIGASAFANCTGLQEIVLPESLTSLGEAAFSGCTALSRATIYAKLPQLSPSTFSGCISLKTVDLPDSLPVIGDMAFLNCSALMKLRLPGSLTAIGKSAFNGCSSLTDLTIPKGVTVLPESVCMGCNALRNVSLTGTITTVSNNAFDGCSSLKRLDFPQGLQEIGNRAFHNCFELKHLTLPDSVSTFGYRIAGCSTAVFAPANSAAARWAASEGHPLNPSPFNSKRGMLLRLLLLPLRTAVILLPVLILLFVAGYFLRDTSPVSDIISAYQGGIVNHRSISADSITGQEYIAAFPRHEEGDGIAGVWNYCRNDLIVPTFTIPSSPPLDIGIMVCSGVCAVLLLIYIIDSVRFVLFRRKPKAKRRA